MNASATAQAHTGLEATVDKKEPPANEARNILVQVGDHMHMLPLARVQLAESDRNYVVFHVGQERFHARCTLQHAEEVLAPGRRMLRISRSRLINIDFLRQVSRTPRGDYIFVLECGVTVTSSEGHRETVRNCIRDLLIETRGLR